MNTMSVWKLVAVLALCGIAASGCTTTRVMVDSVETPQAALATDNKPKVTLLRIEDAITDPNYQVDPTFLGEGVESVGLILVIPIQHSNVFHGERPRAELVQAAFLAKLQSVGLPTRYQSDGRFEQFTNREDGQMVISVRLKKFQVDTKFSALFPLIFVNAIGFAHIKSHVQLECQVLQPGNPAPLWQGTAEGTTESDSETRKNKPLLIQQAIMVAVEQFVQKSSIQQLSMRVRNEAYAKHIKVGQERDATGDWNGAVSHYSKAYDMAMTSEQSLATIQAVAQVVRKQPAKPELSEEARRYGVQANSFVGEKRYEEAISRYDQALASSPWWAETHFNRSMVLSYQDRYAEAITSMKQFLILAPNAPDARAAQDKIYEWELKVK